MTPTLLLPTLLSGFAIAFLHTLIPVHWLPFVLVGRERRWSLAHTLGVNLVAGAGHVAMTALLGLLAVYVGAGIGGLFAETAGRIVAGLLAAAGLFFLWRQFHAGRHAHGSTSGLRALRAARSDRTATLALVVLLLLSPCEAFVPVYLFGTPGDWAGFAALTAALALATLSCMLAMTTLVWRGLARARAERLARWQSGLVGLVFLGLAVLMLLIEG